MLPPPHPAQQPGPWRGVGGGSCISWGSQAAGLDKGACQRKSGKESLGGCPSPENNGYLTPAGH